MKRNYGEGFHEEVASDDDHEEKNKNPEVKKLKINHDENEHDSKDDENDPIMIDTLLPKPLLDPLNHDELRLILEYLPSKDILRLAITSSTMFQTISEMVEHYLAKYCVPSKTVLPTTENVSKFGNLEWNFIDALKTRTSLFITLTNIDQVIAIVEEITDRNGSLDELSNHFIFARDIPFDLVFQLLDLRKIVELRSLREEVWNESKSDEEYEEDISGSIAFEEMIVNTVIIENQENGDFDFDFDLREDIDKYDKDTQLVKIVGIPIGYTLKHLTIRCSCSFEQLLWILTKCKSLESLNLSFYYLDLKICNDHKLCFIDDSMNGEEKNDEKNVQETKQPEFEEYQDHCFFVPIMESMKSLSVLGAFEDNTKERFVLDVIKCCPNLQELEYGFPGLLDDKFLTCFSKMCSKLKAVKLKSYSGATPLECVVSDETVYQFLKSQPLLEHLCIHPCSNISGEIFKKIGEFQQLKELHIQRHTSTHPLVAEARGIYFGGGILHNLTVLDIGDFEFEDHSEEEKLKLKQSLEQVAPNLKKKWGFSLLFEHDDTCSSENSNAHLEW